jgi:hypothetical protein
MNRFVTFAMAAVLSFAASTPAWAQAAGKGATTGTTRQMTAGGITQTPWFTHQNVRSNIGINDQTFNQLNAAYGQAYSTYNQGISQLGTNLTPDQRAQRIQDLQNTFNQRMNQVAQTSITDPTQLSRYNQLALQFQGFDAFNSAQVQQKLNLNDQQRQRLQQLAQQYNQQLNNLQQNARTNPTATDQQFNQLRQQAMQGMNTVLTPQQQQTWQQMTGQPYNFPWSTYFPPAAGQQGGTQQNQR